MATITYVGELVVTSCWCGIQLAVPSDLHDYVKRGQGQIYCPLGHTFIYGDNVREQLARAERERDEAWQRAQATRDLLDHEQRSHAATRGHLTRAKKRAHAGVCPVPCCKRHFRDLERHMGIKHPDYVRE